MTRRRYTYLPGTGWGVLNMLATIGAFLMALGVLVFIINALRSRRSGKIAGNNPWMAGTLEWAACSPPTHYNFLHPPTCRGRDPLWEHAEDTPVVTGLSVEKRQVLVTTTLDACPHHRYDLAGESIWPFLLALAVASTLMLGGIFNPWFVPIFVGVATLVLFGWFWTAPALRERPGAQEHAAHRPGLWWLGRRARTDNPRSKDTQEDNERQREQS